MTQTYDIIIFGGGIAGLFIANRLKSAGFNLILIEKDKLGGGQTLASQGMIHGGQKYALQGKVTAQAASIAAMPERWEACFANRGEVDLSGVKFIDSSGLAVLIRAMQDVQKYGGKLSLAGISTDVRSIFEMARLDQVFLIDSQDELLAAD